MGIVSRKEREKAELKSKILAAAKKLFLEKGISQTSIRNIAEIIEYSPATIYLYFEDKDAILYEIHQQGFAELRKRIIVLLNISDPLERLYQKGLAYIQFVKENPDLYDLMFISDSPMDYIRKCSMNDWDEGKLAFEMLRYTLVQCIEKGYFKGQDPETLAFMIWSTMHGMCALRLRNRLMFISESNQDETLEKGFQCFWEYLRKNASV